MFRSFLIFLLALPTISSVFGQSSTNSFDAASPAVNAIGIDLLRVAGSPGNNVLLSPYSIETALVMTYAGADGKTREEMARVLHLRGDNLEVAKAFATLQRELDDVVQKSEAGVAEMKKYGQTGEPITLHVANRLFGEKHYDFRPAFLDLLKTNFDVPFEAMDFVHHSAEATKTINDWVAQKTQSRIQDLVPPGALNDLTRLVLVNALYFKAGWAEPFYERSTEPRPFHLQGGGATNVPTMSIERSLGYTNADGVTVVSLPYRWGEIQFLIVLPDNVNGLEAAEAELTPDKLTQWARLPLKKINLFLPKFKMEPPTIQLGDALQKLGMTTAFDIPRGSANFDGIAPRQPDDYLSISKVLHKTFISVDEKGTEAAAATAVAMVRSLAIQRPEQTIEVRVDHPFIFAIQHRPSGACLFFGHVADPR